MADKPWKQFERDAAALIGGKRKWANSGERLDIESENFIGQCKLVQKLSLAQLTALAVEMANATTDKFGVVMTKLRAGKGKKTPMLVTMTADQFEALLMHTPFPSEYEQEAQKELDDRHDSGTDPVLPGQGLCGGATGQAEDPRGFDRPAAGERGEAMAR